VHADPVESPFPSTRLRTDAAKRFKQVKSTPPVVWTMLWVAEQVFRLVKQPELAPDVYRGTKFMDGVEVKTEAAALRPLG